LVLKGNSNHHKKFGITIGSLNLN